MSELKLTTQQQAVVENRGGTLLVSAAAGSGKTRVLVERVLNRIVSEGRDINEFLIITFTNAAAAELRAKISQAITEELAAHPHNRHLSRQLNLLPMSHISTVHAFCGALIREYGYLLEIPSDFRMIVEATGVEIINKSYGCCGKSIPDISDKLMAERQAECQGADFIVVGCPNCLTFYDNVPNGVPVVHLSELIAMAAGDRETVKFHKLKL